MLREIGQIAAFLICAQTLLHFRAKDSYEKYIKLVISMMLLLLLARPLFGLAEDKEEMDIVQRIEQYEESMQSMLLERQPQMQDMEAVLQSLAQKAIEESAKKQESIDGTAVPAQEGIETERIVIDRIEIGENNGDSE